jgi:hypothetical protein
MAEPGQGPVVGFERKAPARHSGNISHHDIICKIIFKSETRTRREVPQMDEGRAEREQLPVPPRGRLSPAVERGGPTQESGGSGARAVGIGSSRQRKGGLLGFRWALSPLFW